MAEDVIKYPILIVDDNKSDRLILEAICDQHFVSHDSVEDGFAALEKAAKGTYSLIILDIQMPGMSGLDALKRLRMMRTSASIPILVASAKNQVQDVMLALRSGATDYIVKPIQPEVLAQKLSQYVDTKATEWTEYEIKPSDRMGGAVIMNPIRIHSFSEIGATLKSVNPAQAGALLVVESELFGQPHAKVQCEVKDCQPVEGGFEIKVSFQNISDAIRSALRQRCRLLFPVVVGAR